jgi:tRNA G18 (ribose-2'-O)-methylase SpoU
MHISKATSPQQVVEFQNISRKWRTQFSNGIFYAEGEHVLLRILQSRLKIVSMLITENYLERWKSLIEQKSPTVWIAEKSWMEESIAQKLNQPCLALAKIPPSANVDSLIGEEPSHLVALDGIDHAVTLVPLLEIATPSVLEESLWTKQRFILIAGEP